MKGVTAQHDGNATIMMTSAMMKSVLEYEMIKSMH